MHSPRRRTAAWGLPPPRSMCATSTVKTGWMHLEAESTSTPGTHAEQCVCILAGLWCTRQQNSMSALNPKAPPPPLSTCRWCTASAGVYSLHHDPLTLQRQQVVTSEPISSREKFYIIEFAPLTARINSRFCYV